MEVSGMWLLYLLIFGGKFNSDKVAEMTKCGWKEALLSKGNPYKDTIIRACFTYLHVLILDIKL